MCCIMMEHIKSSVCGRVRSRTTVVHLSLCVYLLMKQWLKRAVSINPRNSQLIAVFLSGPSQTLFPGISDRASWYYALAKESGIMIEGMAVVKYSFSSTRYEDSIHAHLQWWSWNISNSWNPSGPFVRPSFCRLKTPVLTSNDRLFRPHLRHYSQTSGA